MPNKDGSTNTESGALQEEIDNPSGHTEFTEPEITTNSDNAITQKIDVDAEKEQKPRAPSETPIVKPKRGTEWERAKAEKNRLRAIQSAGMSKEMRKGHGIAVQNEGRNLVIRVQKIGINASGLEREIAKIAKKLLD